MLSGTDTHNTNIFLRVPYPAMRFILVYYIPHLIFLYGSIRKEETDWIHNMSEKTGEYTHGFDNNLFTRCATALATSRRALTAWTRVKSQASAREICGLQSGTGTGF